MRRVVPGWDLGTLYSYSNTFFAPNREAEWMSGEGRGRDRHLPLPHPQPPTANPDALRLLQIGYKPSPKLPSAPPTQLLRHPASLGLQLDRAENGTRVERSAAVSAYPTATAEGLTSWSPRAARSAAAFRSLPSRAGAWRRGKNFQGVSSNRGGRQSGERVKGSAHPTYSTWASWSRRYTRAWGLNSTVATKS